MGFINEQLTVSQLPQIDRVNFIPLEKKYMNVLWLNRLVFFLVMSSAFAAVIIFVPFDLSTSLKWVLGGVIGVFLLIFLFLTPAVFRVKAYAIRKRDVLYKSGLFFRSTVIVPFNRVQHIEIKTGPMDRMFHLSRLKIYTAGGSQSDLTIPGLSGETAGRLKELIITKTGIDEEE